MRSDGITANTAPRRSAGISMASAPAVYVGDYETFENAAADLPSFIENIYNATRLHSALGYLSPDKFEESNAPAGPKKAA